MKTLIPKSEVRKLVVQRKSELSDYEIKSKTDKIIERLAQQDDFVHAKTVYCYISGRSGEVNTRKLIDYIEGWGKSIIIPKLNKAARKFHRFQFMGWDDIIRNSEGYYEPRVGLDEDTSDIDLMITPALAVSEVGQRVGYGGGYYDKLLRKTYAPKYVLAFEFQVFANIETDIHDVRIDKIITERRAIDTREPYRFLDS